MRDVVLSVLRLGTKHALIALGLVLTAGLMDDVRGQVLIAISQGPRNAPSHDSPAYIADHISWIERRPFDGIVINDFLGRNLMDARLEKLAPQSLDGSTGAVSYPAAMRGLGPIRGIFKVFRHNFVKVNMLMNGLPPWLTDDSGWAIVVHSAKNYARAVRDSGLEGILFDNENYHRPSEPGQSHPLDYWLYQDQLTLAGLSPIDMPPATAVRLARMRGNQFARALIDGYPGITVIIAHGPNKGCTAWRRVGKEYADNAYLMGAFAAGMVEAANDNAVVVDGGENYTYRTEADFLVSYKWRKGISAPGVGSIADQESSVACPFMDGPLASRWQEIANIAFSTFDEELRPGSATEWQPIRDISVFRQTLRNALVATDRYVWHYTEWQDWWGSSTEDALQPWIDAITAAKRDARAVSRAAKPVLR